MGNKIKPYPEHVEFIPSEANYRLWDVAPEMLVALEDARENCEQCRQIKPETRHCARCQTFGVLIAKARGK